MFELMFNQNLKFFWRVEHIKGKLNIKESRK
jgi:hypothetical protein